MADDVLPEDELDDETDPLDPLANPIDPLSDPLAAPVIPGLDDFGIPDEEDPEVEGDELDPDSLEALGFGIEEEEEF